MINKLGLGTVQWGLAYGVSGQKVITPPPIVTAILTEARANEIKILDTATLYGESEAVLGANLLGDFQVVTKSPKFATPFITDEQATQISHIFLKSLQKLSSRKIYGLLIHHADDLLVPGGEKLVAAMTEIKNDGFVQKVGVSVYDCGQVDAVLEVFKPDIVQLPINVLDQRMLLSGRLEHMKNEGIEIHARSVFLQGLLLMPLNKVPAYFDPIRPLLARWHSTTEVQGMTLTQAALSFVRDIPFVDTVLVGVEDLDQFRSCYADFAVEKTFDATGLACHDPDFMNPGLWRLS